MERELSLAKEKLSSAKSVTVLTGAGVSAESGVPTFRGPGGLWRSFRAEDLATPEAFRRDPALVWQWYDYRRGVIAGLKPNPGHYAVAEMEKRFPGFMLVTQNVDGLHSAAGSKKIVELHGNIWRTRCVADGKTAVNTEVPLKTIPPKCECGALLRPDIVWFGESLDPDGFQRACDASKESDVFIVAGTSSVVFPAAGLSNLARESGAFIIEINPDETPISGEVDACIRGRSGEVLPLLMG